MRSKVPELPLLVITRSSSERSTLRSLTEGMAGSELSISREANTRKILLGRHKISLYKIDSYWDQYALVGIWLFKLKMLSARMFVNVSLPVKWMVTEVGSIVLSFPSWSLHYSSTGDLHCTKATRENCFLNTTVCFFQNHSLCYLTSWPTGFLWLSRFVILWTKDRHMCRIISMPSSCGMLSYTNKTTKSYLFF